MRDAPQDLQDDESFLFGSEVLPTTAFEFDSAYQGQEGLERVCQARAEGRPYAVAFVDVRMPPGWDGIETISHLRRVDPDLQTVVCTAYSDYSWKAMHHRLGYSDSLLILKKPFDHIEIVQLAHALTRKWLVSRQADAKMEELDRMVALRTAELEAARQAAEAGSRAKSEFLAHMSHELRTPMNGILGLTQVLLNAAPTEVQRECLEAVESSARRLMKVFADILDFSEIEAGGLDIGVAAFRLPDWLEDSMNAMLESAREKGLDLRWTIGPECRRVVEGDGSRLRQVLHNLVDNAVKFTSKGSVTVVVTGEPLEAGFLRVHVSVRDTGIGIPAEARPFIFEPFRPAEGPYSRKYGGIGLGLPIAARLAQRMGGRIWVESEEGGGSSFHFTAPLKTGAADSSTGKEPARPEAVALCGQVG